MSTYELDGKMRSRLRETILAGFSPAVLDEVLRDNNMFRHNIAIGPEALSMSLARKGGWLSFAVFLQPRVAAISLSALRFWKYRDG